MDKKKIRVEELTDEQMNEAAGGVMGFNKGGVLGFNNGSGTGFHKYKGGRCPLCGEMCFDEDEMTYIVLKGDVTKVCKSCASRNK